LVQTVLGRGTHSSVTWRTGGGQGRAVYLPVLGDPERSGHDGVIIIKWNAILSSCYESEYFTGKDCIFLKSFCMSLREAVKS
jgi:hypothetical protein